GWGGYVQWGALTRSVRDAAAMLDVMAGPMPGDPYAAPALPRPLAEEVGRDPGALRIGWCDGSLLGREVHAEHRAAVRASAAQLEALGHRVEEVKPEIDREALTGAYFTQVAVGVAGEIDDFARLIGKTPRAADFEPSTWLMNQLGRALRGIELQHARDAAQAASRAMGTFHESHDVLLCATVTHPQVPIGELTLGAAERAGLSLLRALPSERVLKAVIARLGPEFLELTPNTQLFNQTGQPAVSLPLHRAADGLPIGVQLAAALGREDVLVRLAAQLEAAHPWHDHLPRIHA
ncbi:MAG: amidase family protein, partial [Myxococcales bacterium]|nr:amidase family protein [Myxococcales bacterium]